jgi:hypothetical protein
MKFGADPGDSSSGHTLREAGSQKEGLEGAICWANSPN